MSKSLIEIQLSTISEELDDIISSGSSWTTWHQDEIAEALKEYNVPARRAVFKHYYCNGVPEGTTLRELTFMSKLCKSNISNVDLSQLEKDVK